MKTNIFKNQNFILGVEEEWDIYYEVAVKFVEEVTINNYWYHVFSDENTGKTFYLRPLFSGHPIEGIFIEKRIDVSISKKEHPVDKTNTKIPTDYATGILKLPPTLYS
ncbi:hypothetical protein GW781_13445 [bacterium]|nr:hypothetical protein [bacterium]NCT22142.1 hypothetical protein [bacterium]OIO85317.1 MAG: hypothetical protein AUK01_06495 [Anaerolineae bacterium CG2_30_57_67]